MRRARLTFQVHFIIFPERFIFHVVLMLFWMNAIEKST